MVVVVKMIGAIVGIFVVVVGFIVGAGVGNGANFFYFICLYVCAVCVWCVTYKQTENTHTHKKKASQQSINQNLGVKYLTIQDS